MNQITLLKMLHACNYDSILKLKIALIRNKKMGLVFYKESMGELELDQPFEFYFHATKGTITYQNAFPVPKSEYKTSRKKKANVDYLLPFYGTYYKTSQNPELKYFKTLSRFMGENYVWFYKGSVCDE